MYQVIRIESYSTTQSYNKAEHNKNSEVIPSTSTYLCTCSHYYGTVNKKTRILKVNTCRTLALPPLRLDIKKAKEIKRNLLLAQLPDLAKGYKP